MTRKQPFSGVATSIAIQAVQVASGRMGQYSQIPCIIGQECRAIVAKFWMALDEAVVGVSNLGNGAFWELKVGRYEAMFVIVVDLCCRQHLVSSFSKW